MAALKYSQFNHVVPIPGEEAWGVHNFATDTTERLDVVQKALFDMATSLPVSSPVVRRWRAAGFLVDAHLDEVAYLRKLVRKRIHERACGSGPVPLVLTVCVTRACNFACPYCFQESDAARMPEEVQRSLVSFVESRLATGRHDALSVDWFGGEPLLETQTIERMSQQLLELAERYDVPYRAMVHTNGYLLDEQTVRLLERCRVRNVLVTIDGDRAAHDANRHLRGGGPSYDRIVANLYALRTDMHVIVRCNLHEGNVDSLTKLKSLVEDIARSSGTQMRLLPRAVRPSPAASERDDDKTAWLSHERYAQILAESGEIARCRSFAPTLSRCSVMRLNELYVDVDGTLYPCCNHSPNFPQTALGNVLDDESVSWEAAANKIFDLLGFPDARPECLSCKLLVCCHGGCPHNRHFYKSPPCPEELSDPDAYVLARCAELG